MTNLKTHRTSKGPLFIYKRSAFGPEVTLSPKLAKHYDQLNLPCEGTEFALTEALHFVTIVPATISKWMPVKMARIKEFNRFLENDCRHNPSELIESLEAHWEGRRMPKTQSSRVLSDFFASSGGYLDSVMTLGKIVLGLRMSLGNSLRELRAAATCGEEIDRKSIVRKMVKQFEQALTLLSPQRGLHGSSDFIDVKRPKIPTFDRADNDARTKVEVMRRPTTALAVDKALQLATEKLRDPTKSEVQEAMREAYPELSFKTTNWSDLLKKAGLGGLPNASPHSRRVQTADQESQKRKKPRAKVR